MRIQKGLIGQEDIDTLDIQVTELTEQRQVEEMRRDELKKSAKPDKSYVQ